MPQEKQCSLDERKSYLNFTTSGFGRCVSKEPIRQTSCSGNCYGQEEPTMSVTDGYGGIQLVRGQQSCTCCQGIGNDVKVTVQCRESGSNDIRDLELTMKYFTECSCMECGGQYQ